MKSLIGAIAGVLLQGFSAAAQEQIQVLPVRGQLRHKTSGVFDSSNTEIIFVP